jgi:hypothetical protein
MDGISGQTEYASNSGRKLTDFFDMCQTNGHSSGTSQVIPAEICKKGSAKGEQVLGQLHKQYPGKR